MKINDYEIVQSAGAPSPSQTRPSLHRISILASWLLWLLYIGRQYTLVRSLTLEFPDLRTILWLLYISEPLLEMQQLVLAANALVPLLSSWTLHIRPRLQLVGDNAPKVVVAITCCGENVDVVMRTVIAASAQRYPADRLTIILLDDGHDPLLEKDMIDLSQKSNVAIKYLARSSNKHFKAGNLHFGIKVAKEDINPEFFASLDADMVPHPEWLRRMLPHMLLDDQLALACPPQGYNNVPTHDPLAQQTDLDVWFRHLEYLNDHLGAAMCTGSGFVVRIDALESIGGWPLTDAGEDFMCSTVLNAAGWKTAFIPEPDLQQGMCPDSLVGHISQRQRWVDSGMAVHKQFGYWLSKKSISSTTPGQRAVRVMQLLRELSPLATMFACVAMPYSAYKLSNVIIDEAPSLAKRCIYLFCAQAALRWINDQILYGHIGRTKFAYFLALDIWCAPYMAFRTLTYMIPKPIAKHMAFEFKSSGSVTSVLNERSKSRRVGLSQRVWNKTFLFQSLIASYFLLPLVMGFTRSVNIWPSELTSEVIPLLLLFPGALLKLLHMVVSSLVPLSYLIWPPTTAE